MPLIGFIVVLAAFLSYFIMIFVFLRFTYRTWIFDIIIGVGMVMGGLGWYQESSSWSPWSAIIVGGIWFVVSRLEFRLVGSKKLILRAGSSVPNMAFVTTDGENVSEQDLIENAPTLLVLYRGWWCPSSKTQLDEIVQYYEELNAAGLKIYAASVDSPTEAVSIQEYVGDKITVLCNVSEALLDEIGVRDQRGAPWYDRLLFGAAHQNISMPTAIVINRDSKIAFITRSTKVDSRPRSKDILASISRTL